jgi:CubicO group peptidase (beta-lactamase class C family)
MKRTLITLLIALAGLAACEKNETSSPTVVPPSTLYFPPVTGTNWEMTSPATLGWSTSSLAELETYLQSKNTKAFIILKNGRIVMEKYFGSFTADSNWYWASAGKTVTAMLVGIANKEGLLNIENRTSQYLGTGWTSAPLTKENLITVKHQLTMTTGLDDGLGDDDCTLQPCLQYKADAGTRWAYHNAPYTLLDKVVENASGKTFNTYFQEKIRNRIGMNGAWFRTGSYNNVYYSNARSMARFGLLMLNKGVWDKTAILNDSSFFNKQVNSSQTLNLSYGYLTWLNGKASHMMPTIQIIFNGSMVPAAPSDMYAALGKNDQKIYVVPSQNIVVIRMGDSAGNVQLAASSFDNELWAKLKPILGY